MKRNITLDYYRIILSITVVFTHLFISVAFNPEYTKYLNDIEYAIMWEISELAKIVVPSFLMISGFYLNTTDRKKMFKFLVRIVKIYIIWALFYLPWSYYNDHRLTLITLFMGFYHLWYLSALIGAIILIYILNFVFKIKNDWILFIIAISLYIGGYIIQLLLPANSGTMHLYRNAIYYALPFVILGIIIRKNISKIKFSVNLFHVIVGIILILIEGYFYLIPRVNYDMFISAFIVAPIIFIYILQKGKMVEVSNKDLTHIASGIYYIHPAVLMINTRVLPFFDTNVVLSQFPFMLIVTVFITFLIIHVNKTVKIFL